MRTVGSVLLLLQCLSSVLAAPAPSRFSVVQERVPVRYPRNGPDALKRAYLKYGYALPKYLERRGEQGSVANQPYSYGDGYIDDEYLSAIYIGTPPQKLLVDLDTGSADSWVYSSDTPYNDGRNNHSYYNAPKSTTSKKLKGYTYNITYGDGSQSNGDVYTDVVTYAGATFPSQAVEAMEYVSPDYLIDLNFDGFLALGHDGGNQVLPVPQKTFFTNVAPSLSEPLFTLSLNHLNPGVNDFGFVDPKKSSERVQYFPSLPPPAGHGWWVVNSTGYSVGNAKKITPFVGGLHAIIDSGTTFLLLPQQYCDAYYAQAPSVVFDPDYGYICPCKATLPDLTLAIGSYQAKIPGSLLIGANINSTTCQTGLNAIPVGPGIPQAVYGDTFLKTTFTVFKYPPGGSPSLGFASKSISCSYQN
ncbi:Type I transmembrane sorting receptor [Xylographa parallela]|nr:Type I transmembrane sorting receptor [Xylographa parallela]